MVDPAIDSRAAAPKDPPNGLDANNNPAARLRHGVVCRCIAVRYLNTVHGSLKQRETASIPDHAVRLSTVIGRLFFGGHRLSVIMYMGVPTATWEVSMNFLQDKRVLWGGAVIIVLIVLLVLFGWPGGETPPAQ